MIIIKEGEKATVSLKEGLGYAERSFYGKAIIENKNGFISVLSEGEKWMYYFPVYNVIGVLVCDKNNH